MPLVSVITISLNNKSGIEKTIQSVLDQNYPNIEYIVIDGGSNDGTAELIRNYRSRLKYSVSEKDDGISDAFNKGLKEATGEYIAFLNSGDYYLHENAIAILVNGAEKCDVIYGGIYYQRKYKPNCYPKDISDTTYWTRGSIPHQSAITCRKVFEEIGPFNPGLKYCMDYELFYKAYQAGFKFSAVPVLITSVNCEGVSTMSWKAQLDEFRKIQKERGAPVLAREYYYVKRLLKMWMYYTLISFKIIR